MNTPSYWMGRLMFWLEEDKISSRKISIRACCDVASVLMVMDGLINGIDRLVFTPFVVSVLVIVIALNLVLAKQTFRGGENRRN